MGSRECNVIKNDGTKCQGRAIKSESFCWQHRPDGYKIRWRGKKEFNDKISFRIEDTGKRTPLGKPIMRLCDFSDDDVQWHVFIKMKPYSIRNGKIHDPQTDKYLPVLSAVKGAPLAVWIYIASCIDENGSAFPGRATISAATGYSKATVTKATKRLEELGLITIMRCFVDGANSKSNSYNVDDHFFSFCDNRSP